MSVCLWVKSLRKSLPDVLAEQVTRRDRFEFTGPRMWIPSDEITCRLRYENGKTSYEDLKRNGKPTTADAANVLHSGWSTGEYAAILESAFEADQEPVFTFSRQETRKGRAVLEFEFKIRKERNHTYSLTDGRWPTIYPGMEGRLSIDAESHQLLTVERKTLDDVDPKYPLTRVETTVNYHLVHLSDRSDVVLPSDSVVTACRRNGDCFRSNIRFENWRKFGVEHRINVDVPAMPPGAAASPSNPK